MTTIGIIGAGEVGSQIARAAIACGYSVAIANSRGPETLRDLINELGPAARAETAAGAAAAGDVVVVAVPLKLVNDMPASELVGKIVLDTNNYMAWRDGHFPIVDSGRKPFMSFVRSSFQAQRSPRRLPIFRLHGSPFGESRKAHPGG